MSAILIRLLMFLLPFVIFFIVIRIIKTHQTKDGVLDEATERILGNASRIGIFLMVGMGFYVAFTGETNRDGNYVPPQEIDGEIVPGHFEDCEGEGDDDTGGPDDPAEDDGAEDDDGG